jgi:hypothetical protein
MIKTTAERVAAIRVSFESCRSYLKTHPDASFASPTTVLARHNIILPSTPQDGMIMSPGSDLSLMHAYNDGVKGHSSSSSKNGVSLSLSAKKPAGILVDKRTPHRTTISVKNINMAMSSCAKALEGGDSDRRASFDGQVTGTVGHLTPMKRYDIKEHAGAHPSDHEGQQGVTASGEKALSATQNVMRTPSGLNSHAGQISGQISGQHHHARAASASAQESNATAVPVPAGLVTPNHGEHVTPSNHSSVPTPGHVTPNHGRTTPNNHGNVPWTPGHVTPSGHVTPHRGQATPVNYGNGMVTADGHVMRVVSAVHGDFTTIGGHDRCVRVL